MKVTITLRKENQITFIREVDIILEDKTQNPSILYRKDLCFSISMVTKSDCNVLLELFKMGKLDIQITTDKETAETTGCITSIQWVNDDLLIKIDTLTRYVIIKVNEVPTSEEKESKVVDVTAKEKLNEMDGKLALIHLLSDKRTELLDMSWQPSNNPVREIPDPCDPSGWSFFERNRRGIDILILKIKRS